MRRLAAASIALASLSSLAVGQTAMDAAVRASAVAQASPPRITISWPADQYATGYQISRKAKDATNWGAVVASPAAAATSWVDSTVTAGQAWEYRIVKTSATYTGTGYLFSGIQYAAADTHGAVLLLVDSSQAPGMASQLQRLTLDLIAEGWSVVRRDVGRTQAVTAVKAVIEAVRSATPSLEAVLIVGHVPVPYSGNLNPDGHPDHQGAWPADVYYGVPTGSWTDNSVDNATASRAANQNVPGDGKFDQTTIPAEVALEVGRVDLADMPNFQMLGGIPRTEADLLAYYLDKNHEFRSGAKTYRRRAFVDDNFGYMGGEAFAATGWRAGAAFFGADSTIVADFVHAGNSLTWLYAYGCGPGSYGSAGGIGPVDSIARLQLQMVFTSLFGSYFGDWDNSNAFLRAPLASRPSTLACFWAGRPHWQLHHMALGEDLGYATRLSQNNNGTYVGGFGMHYVHIALMGDPTLRLLIVRPPSGLQAARTSASSVDLSWTASPDTVAGYHVYRSSQTLGHFTRLTTTPVAALAYTDNGAGAGVYTYLVRPSRLETSASGTFYNVGPGVMDSVDANITILSDSRGAAACRLLSLEPVSAGGMLRMSIGLATAGQVRVSVRSLAGRTIVEQRLAGQVGRMPVSLDLSRAAAGVYLLDVEAGAARQSARFVVR